MTSTINTLLVLGFIAVVVIKRCDWLSLCGVNSIDDVINQISSGGSGSGGGRSGVVNAKAIYQSTGKVIPGSRFSNKSQACWKMSSGGCRSSARFQCEKGCCVPYHDLEATVYVHVGPLSANRKGNSRLILTAGGPGQSGNNCCVYSLGFTEQGQAYAEEEGAHSPHPHIYPMTVTGGNVRNIGPLANRTIGLKNIIWHSGGQTHVEGWVDSRNNGNWEKFYYAVNPHGGSLPVITHSPMVGSTCQEVRCRIDNFWPVTFDASRSGIEELQMPLRPASGPGAGGYDTPQALQQLAGVKPAKTKKKNNTNKKKSHYTSIARIAI